MTRGEKKKKKVEAMVQIVERGGNWLDEAKG